MKYPNIWQDVDLFQYMLKSETTAAIEIKPNEVHWMPARPLGFMSMGQRIKAAWLVFTGQADAVKWTGQ